MRMRKWAIALVMIVGTAMATAAQAADSLKFTETYSESLKRFKEGGVTSFEEVVKDSLSISGNILLEEEIFFDKETEWSISLGDFSLEGTIGEDPKAKLGRKGKASIPIKNEDGKPVGKATFSWTTKALKFSVKLTTSDPAEVLTALALEFTMEEKGSINETIEEGEASVIIGDLLVDFTVNGSAKGSCGEVIKEEEPFFLCKIKLTGTGTEELF